MLRLFILSALLIGLSACGHKTLGCSAADAQIPAVSIVKEQLEKQIASRVKDEGSEHGFSLSKIRAAIAQLVITIEDIRTSKEDPNSTKRFCTGTVKVRFPAAVLDDAEKTREAAQAGTISELADNSGVDRAADTFSTPLEFNVQPTDSGDKVFAEVESGNPIFKFTSDVVASSLLRSTVENAKREQDQAVAAQTAAENAAITEQRNANLNAAKTENQLAAQTINATWNAISSDMRGQILPLQRAWVRKKAADCRVESAAASTDPTEIEVARLACDTRVTQDRIRWLNQYRSAEPAGDGQE
jgi:uncharacterized protein YecT (DUF1311 family)